MKTIYIAIGREAVGPLSHEEVKKGLKDGRWDAKFRIWHPGLENWTPLHQVEMDRSTIVSEFASSPPPIPPSYPGGKALFGLAGIVAVIVLCLFFTRVQEPHLLAENTTHAKGGGMQNPPETQTIEEKAPTSQGKNSQLKSESLPSSTIELSKATGERLEAIFFEKNSSNIDTTADAVLNRSVALLKNSDYPKFSSLTVVGYASSEGSISENETLSLSRANAVKSRLQKAGFLENQIVVMPGGQANKAAEEDPNPKMNRRVEIFVVR